MTSLKKSDKKAVLDFAAWSFNATTSVGIIMVNKALMAKHGFTFGMSVALCLTEHLFLIYWTTIFGI